MSAIELPSRDEVQLHLKAVLPRLVACGLSVDDIYECVSHYHSAATFYEEALQHFVLELQRPLRLGQIHSIRFRLKDPRHLAEKIARKAYRDKKVIRKATLLTDEGVTDLAGVRILNLRRSEWLGVHKFLCEPKASRVWAVHEKTAYVRDLDAAKEDQRSGGLGLKPYFEDDEIEKNKRNYTSLHYTIRWPVEAAEFPAKYLYFECQVRTLFEEGWGEIDHQLNYPHPSNPVVREQLRGLNQAASTANDIAQALESLESLPLFVSWETEQELERSATGVTCVSQALDWVHDNLNDAIEQFTQGTAPFRYLVIRRDIDTLRTVATLWKKLRSRNLESRVNLQVLPYRLRDLPVVGDVLFLFEAVGPNSHSVESIVVIGTPSRRTLRSNEKLDMVLDESEHVAPIRRFLSRFERTDGTVVGAPITWESTLDAYLSRSNEDAVYAKFIGRLLGRTLKTRKGHIRWLDVGPGPGTKAKLIVEALHGLGKSVECTFVEPCAYWRARCGDLIKPTMQSGDSFRCYSCTLQDFVSLRESADAGFDVMTFTHVLYSQELVDAAIGLLAQQARVGPATAVITVEAQVSDFAQLRDAVGDAIAHPDPGTAAAVRRALKEQNLDFKQVSLAPQETRVEAGDDWLLPFLLGDDEASVAAAVVADLVSALPAPVAGTKGLSLSTPDTAFVVSVKVAP